MANALPVRDTEMRRRFVAEYEARERRFKEEEERKRRENELSEAEEVTRDRISSQNQTNADSENSNSATFEERPEPPDPSERPVCRICFDGEDSGRLFSPCLCRGSVGKVHVDCLNNWRSLSSNPHSFYKCDQCGYTYNIKRAVFAIFLEKSWVVQSATMLLIIALLCVCAQLAHLSKFGLADRFYHLVMWRPFWKHWVQGLSTGRVWWMTPSKVAAWLDWGVAGGVLMGISGFISLVFKKLRINPEHFYKYVGPSLLVTCLQHGTPACRIFAVIGIGVAYQNIYGTVHDASKYVMLRFGEKVLEVARPE